MFVEEIKKRLLLVLNDLGISISKEEIKLEHPADPSFGDYSTNIALYLKSQSASRRTNVKTISQISKPGNPRKTAETIVTEWKKLRLPDFVEKVEVAGPGFINIWLNFDAFGKVIAEVLKQGNEFGRSDWGNDKTIVIDYSAPNIAKPFGIGHLRSTNIGKAIYNLYEFGGWQTIGDNHLGDWGTQFGKLIYQIKQRAKSKEQRAEEEFLRNLTIEELEKLYVDFHKEAEERPELEEEARKWFKKLEEGDPEAKKIWQACVDISLKEFERVYNLLGVKIDFAYGESFYQDKMAEVLEDCREKGILKESQGAQVVEVSGMELPAMLVKSDGATTYLLRDLATIKFRMKEWDPSLIVYEVGVDQTLHFQQLFNVATQLGYGNLDMFVHVGHGLIRWKSGKFSTRKGETIHLEEVLNEAIKRAAAFAPPSGEASTSQRNNIAEAAGIGAIKYNDLKQNPRTDIVFDWDQILSLQGNSGPYLQYTYARTASVLANSKCKAQNVKLKFKTQSEFNNLTIQQLSNEEVSIIRTIYRFPEIVMESAQTFSPNLLCNFLFDLAQKFNLFYDKQRIIGSENEDFRLSLTAAVGQILQNGLTLLGLQALEKM